VGDDFQRQTMYERGRLPDHYLDWDARPDVFKTISTRVRTALSAPTTSDGAGCWEILARRRSVRRFRDEAVPETALSQLLWAAQGITQTSHGHGLRTAPSSGALYPIETYVVIHAVDDIESGIYHYSVPDHSLDQLRCGDFRAEVARAALDQSMAAHANFVFVWTAIFERSKWKYGQRAYRYVYLDAGHLAQNVALGAVALGLGSCQVGALYDLEVNWLLEIDGIQESAIYMTAVGRPADR